MGSSFITIFSPRDSTRLRFIAGTLLEGHLGLSWHIETDRQKITSGPVVNYSDEIIDGAFWISPSSLLFETGLKALEIKVERWSGLPVFFTAGKGDFPFDIFAASFFMLSRYEEYLDHQPDQHGRFTASSSLAFRNGFLDIPVVDLWIKMLSIELKKKFPGIVLREYEFKSLLTIDTDEPFAYLGKNPLTSAVAWIRDMLAGHGKGPERLRVLRNKEKDPFDNYEYITSAIEKYRADAIFFFPSGNKTPFDVNPSWKNKEYIRLVRSISSDYRTGIHPSYGSHERSGALEDEIERLKSITGEKAVLSRFHYLKFSFPSSFRKLISAGITEDYSLAYPDEPGFRAGTARPFNFYDISEETVTGLKIIPLQVMDATLFQYKNLDASQSGQIISNLIVQSRRAGGLFVSLWHNTTLTDTVKGREWRSIFESVLKSCQQ